MTSTSLQDEHAEAPGRERANPEAIGGLPEIRRNDGLLLSRSGEVADPYGVGRVWREHLPQRHGRVAVVIGKSLDRRGNPI